MFSASFLSRFMSNPSEGNLKDAKRVLRYLKGTADLGIKMKRGGEVKITGFCDSDWAGSKQDCRSTSGFVFLLGDSAFSWQSKKQDVVAQSTAEAEYISASVATNQAIWLQRFIGEFGYEHGDGVPIFCDNQSAIAIGKNPVQHKRTKHIEIRYHVVREAEKNRQIKLQYCRTEEQLADMFTKPLGSRRFEELKEKLGLKTN